MKNHHSILWYIPFWLTNRRKVKHYYIACALAKSYETIKVSFFVYIIEYSSIDVNLLYAQILALSMEKNV